MDLDDMNDEFDGDGDESLVRLPDPNADKANLQRGKPLENLLMAKNRKMQDEVTALRVAHDELAAAHETVMADYEALQSRLQEQTALNDRLENDLLRINESRHGGQAQPSSANREDPLAGFQLGKKVSSHLLYVLIREIDSLDSSRSLPKPRLSSRSLSRALPRPPSCPSLLPSEIGSDSAILSWKRYVNVFSRSLQPVKLTALPLPQELRRQFNTISELRSEIKTLQADNLKLYEKVRYLQSYRDENSAAKQQAGFSNVVRGDEELVRYQNKYEESMNPFEAFRGRVGPSSFPAS